jgi:hypothetical protein
MQLILKQKERRLDYYSDQDIMNLFVEYDCLIGKQRSMHEFL